MLTSTIASIDGPTRDLTVDIGSRCACFGLLNGGPWGFTTRPGARVRLILILLPHASREIVARADLVLSVLFTVLYAARCVFSSMVRATISASLSYLCSLVRLRWDSPPLSTAFSSLVSLSAGAWRSPLPMYCSGPTSPSRSPAVFWSHSSCSQSKDHSMEKMTAVWLLPTVAAGVAAANGALLIPHLSGPEAFTVLIWAFSVSLADEHAGHLAATPRVAQVTRSGEATPGWLAPSASNIDHPSAPRSRKACDLFHKLEFATKPK
jgi:hypothetical protein